MKNSALLIAAGVAAALYALNRRASASSSSSGSSSTGNNASYQHSRVIIDRAELVDYETGNIDMTEEVSSMIAADGTLVIDYEAWFNQLGPADLDAEPMLRIVWRHGTNGQPQTVTVPHLGSVTLPYE